MKSKSSNQTSAVWNLPFNQNKKEIQVFETKKNSATKQKKKTTFIFSFSLIALPPKLTRLF